MHGSTTHLTAFSSINLDNLEGPKTADLDTRLEIMHKTEDNRAKMHTELNLLSRNSIKRLKYTQSAARQPVLTT